MSDDALYDPSEHSVQEVNDYLASADPAEVQRVLQAEGGEGGRQRVSILRPAGALPEDDGVEVELLHHWTDAKGESHAPGAKVTVPATVAENLRAGHFAKPEGADAEDGDSA